MALSGDINNPGSSSGTNYWSRSGTLLSPATSGDTLKVGDGSASVPSYAFESDPNTGIGWVSADRFIAIANSAEMQQWNATTGEVVVNDGGAAYDFRVEGDTETNLLMVDASTDRVGFFTGTPSYDVHLAKNETGSVDFVVENLNTTAFAVAEARVGAFTENGGITMTAHDLHGIVPFSTGTIETSNGPLNLTASTSVNISATAIVDIQPGSGSLLRINDSGLDVDVRIEGDTDTTLFFSDASTDRIGIGTATPQSLLDASSATGAVLTISRNDTTVTSGESIGKIQWWNNDSTLTTQNIYGSIEVQAAQTISTDAAVGKMIFSLTPNVIAASTSAQLTLTAVEAQIANAGTSSTSILTTAATQTLTNKRVTPRVTSVTSSATPTINTDLCDAVTITALATDITSMTTNLSGTPLNFDKLIIRFKDDGTARAITWGSSFAAYGVALPTTTVISKVLTVGFIYDSVAAIWGCVASVEQ